MAAVNRLNHNPARITLNGDAYLDVVQFETNNTSDPDGGVYDADLTIARADTGDITVTYSGDRKPQAIPFAIGSVVEDDANMFIKYTGYTASTGVATFTTYTNSGGTISAADTTDKTIQLFLVCTKKALTIT